MSHGGRHERVRSTLVVSEVALACVLLIGAGLLLRSFLRLLDVDLGFAPAHVASIEIEIDDRGSAARRGSIAQAIVDRVRAIPGVDAAAITDMLPPDRNRSSALAAQSTLNDTRR